MPSRVPEQRLLLATHRVLARSTNRIVRSRRATKSRPSFAGHSIPQYERAGRLLWNIDFQRDVGVELLPTVFGADRLCGRPEHEHHPARAATRHISLTGRG